MGLKGPESVFIDCRANPAADYFISEKTRSLDEGVKTLFESAYDPSSGAVAEEIISDIESQTGIYTDDQLKENLRTSIKFALYHSIPPSDITEMAMDVFYNTDNEENFVYALMTVIAIRVAGILNHRGEDRLPGGAPIARDFYVLATEVENFIRQGRVAIETGNIGLQDSNHIRRKLFSYQAIYTPFDNKLKYQTINGGSSVLTLLGWNQLMFKTIIHECVHIYQDAGGGKSTYSDLEEEASELAEKTNYLLLEEFFSIVPSADYWEFQEERRRLTKFKISQEIQGLECMGYTDNMIEFEIAHWQEVGEIKEMWSDAIHAEMEGETEQSREHSSELFTELLKNNHLYTLTKDKMYSAQSKIAESAHGDRNGASSLTSEVNSHSLILIRSRQEFLNSNHYTDKGATAAKNYLSELAVLMVYSSHVGDHKILNGLVDEYLQSADEIGTALLYEEYSNDGL